jgi:anti-anti-sigma regulatory factor
MTQPTDPSKSSQHRLRTPSLESPGGTRAQIPGCEFYRSGTVIVARVLPDFDPQRGAVEFERFLDFDRRGPSMRLLINLERSPVLSAMIGALITLQTSCRRVGGTMAICSLNRTARDALKLTRLDQQFVIYADETEGVSGLAAM